MYNDTLVTVQKWPKGAETPTKRELLGKELSERWRNGREDRRVRAERWDKCRALYFSEDPDLEVSEDDEESKFLNVVQYIVDGLGTHVVGTVTSQQPYCHATMPVDTTEATASMTKVQKTVWFFAERGKIENALQRVSQPAAWSNAGHIRPEWDSKRLRPKFNVHEPDETVVYPATVTDVTDATFYSCDLWRMQSKVEKLQKSGFYLEGKVTAWEDPGAQKEQTYPSIQGEIRHTPVKPSDGLCRLAYGWFTDEDDKPWWVTLSPQDETVLRFQQVPETYLEHDLFKFGYKNETGSGYYSKGSVVNDLQNGQNDANDLWNLFFEGLRMNVYSVGFAEGYPGAKTVEKYKAGDIVSAPGMSGIQMYNPRADLTYVPQATWQILDHQSLVARISPAGVGGEFKSGTTATAAGGAMQGQQAGINEYISVFGKALEGDDGLFAWIQRAVHTHWDEWFPKYGQFLGLEEDDHVLFTLDIEWKLAASTPSATPMAQTQAIQTLVPMAGQMPGLGLDQYALGSALVALMQKQGVLPAGKYQLPADPTMFVQEIAAKTGIPPELIAQGINAAKQQLESAQSLEAAPEGPQGEPGVDIGQGMA